MNALVQREDADPAPPAGPRDGDAACRTVASGDAPNDERSSRNSANDLPALRVVLLHDLICPWSYLGAHRVVRALQARGGLNWSIDWQPFLLNPDLPRGGMAYAEFHRQKSGTPDRLRHLETAIATMGRADGIRFDFGRIERVPCTIPAHRAILWASTLIPEPARLAAFVLAIFGAHFSGARDISLPGTLAELAAPHGLDADALRSILLGGRAASDLVRARSRANHPFSINGIPCLVTSDGLALAGAQEPAAIERLIDVALTPPVRQSALAQDIQPAAVFPAAALAGPLASAAPPGRAA